MKSIICVLSLLFAVQQAEAHNYRASYNKKSYSSYSHLNKNHHHQHDKHSCGTQPTPPPGPVCTDDERVVNGDFEDNAVTNSSQWQLLTSLTGWKINWTQGDCCKNAPWAELQAFPSEQMEGSTQYIELDTHYQNTQQCSAKTNIQISQNIETRVGEILKLEFNYKPRSLSYGKMELTVDFGDNNLVFGNFSNTNWKTFSKEYKVTSRDVRNGKMPLVIKDTGLANTYGMFVDNVSVKATNCTPTPKMCTSAASVVSYLPAAGVAALRSNPSKALGQPDGEPVVESNPKFASLGFGGQITLKLDSPVKNVVGPDLRIWETTGGNQTYAQYPEEADVYVSADGLTWIFAGHVLNDNNDEALGMVDIGSLEEASYVKIVDRSPIFNEAGRDGFDVDAVTCVNQINEFEGNFFYIDNAAKKIYKGALEGNNVFLKEFMNSPYSSAHIGQSDFETLVVVESSGNKRIKEVNIESKVQTDAGRFNFLGTLDQVYASENNIIANQEGTNKIYNQNIELNTTTLMATVMYNQNPLILKGGDFYQGLSGILYMVTNQDGGSLYALENDPANETILNATLVVKGLGSVTGLVQLPTGELLVSLLNSTTMKVIDVYLGTVRSVNLKGDLQKQGSKGGDLAGFDTL